MDSKPLRKLSVALLIGALSWVAVAAAATWEEELRRGRALEQQGRVNEAVLAFVRAEKQASRPETLRQLAFTLHRLRRFPSCQQVAARWVSSYPEDIDALDSLGVCALNAGNSDIAIDAFRRALARQDDPKRQLWLSHAAYAQGDYKTARDAAREGLTLTSRREEVEIALGSAELALGNIAEAKRLLGDKPILGLTYVDAEGGFRVIRVLRNGPADRAGLRVNDVVTRINDRQVGADAANLADQVAAQPVGAEVTLGIQRDGRTLSRSVVLSLDPPAPIPPIPSKDVAGDDGWSENSLRLRGVRVEPDRIILGNTFRIHIELSANGTAADISVPVTLMLSITQDGRILTRTEWVARIPSHQSASVIKEVPRAAGRPGIYGIEVQARGAGGLAAGLGQFEIIADTAGAY